MWTVEQQKKEKGHYSEAVDLCTSTLVLVLLLPFVLASYPESPVMFHHNVSKVDSFSAANKLSDLRMVIGPDVVAHKVPVDAVLAALLFVQHNIRGWKKQE